MYGTFTLSGDHLFHRHRSSVRPAALRADRTLDLRTRRGCEYLPLQSGGDADPPRLSADDRAAAHQRYEGGTSPQREPARSALPGGRQCG